MADETTPASFEEMAGAWFSQAADLGFPAFMTEIADSTPVNAAPYLARYRDFIAAAAEWPGRDRLIGALDEVRRASRTHGITVEAILLGGSFTDRANVAPRDVDCILLYRQANGRQPVDARALAELRKRAREKGVDARFLPLDGDPIPLIKSLCYFTILFSQTKAGGTVMRGGGGIVLLDCRN